MLIQCSYAEEKMINKSLTQVNWNCVIACFSLDLLHLTTDFYQDIKSFHLKGMGGTSKTEYNHVLLLHLHSDYVNASVSQQRLWTALNLNIILIYEILFTYTDIYADVITVSIKFKLGNHAFVYIHVYDVLQED